VGTRTIGTFDNNPLTVRIGKVPTIGPNRPIERIDATVKIQQFGINRRNRMTDSIEIFVVTVITGRNGTNGILHFAELLAGCHNGSPQILAVGGRVACRIP
jgi:hypothetical protein